ncbi:MAG: hypothetical protein G01um101444_422 [Parcubacteria group bacterium Gr01-1014_44]|nr:MAG: hypothetical protein G01um101444_422 [Parcubacteria group bacterium Gr01-1014_44]
MGGVEKFIHSSDLLDIFCVICYKGHSEERKCSDAYINRGIRLRSGFSILTMFCAIIVLFLLPEAGEERTHKLMYVGVKPLSLASGRRSFCLV